MTLKTLSSRTQRNTDTPSGNINSVRVKIVSVILPMTTKQSNRLKSETKYPWRQTYISLVQVSVARIFQLS